MDGGIPQETDDAFNGWTVGRIPISSSKKYLAEHWVMLILCVNIQTRDDFPVDRSPLEFVSGPEREAAPSIRKCANVWKYAFEGKAGYNCVGSLQPISPNYIANWCGRGIAHKSRSDRTEHLNVVFYDGEGQVIKWKGYLLTWHVLGVVIFWYFPKISDTINISISSVFIDSIRDITLPDIYVEISRTFCKNNLHLSYFTFCLSLHHASPKRHCMDGMAFYWKWFS